MLSNNLMLEVRIPPDKYTLPDIGVKYHGEELQNNQTTKESSDNFTDPNYTDYGIHVQQNVYGYQDITTEAEISFPLGSISTMITGMISINPMLEIRTPPDKFTVINSLIYKRTNRVIELPDELWEKVKPNRSVDCCKMTTSEV